MRAPSIRNPGAIRDVLAISLAHLLVTFVVLRVARDRLVRYELLVVLAALSPWVFRAVYHVPNDVDV